MSTQRQHTDESRNLALGSTSEETSAIPPALLEAEVDDGFLDALARCGGSLAVSREYEHFVVLLAAVDGRLHQSAFEVPHPSGLYYDQVRRRLVVASTRTPHQLIFFEEHVPNPELESLWPADLPRPEGELFVPKESWVYPGTLNVHDIVWREDHVVANVTGHNFIAELRHGGNWKRIWSPRCVAPLGRDAYRENHLQLNSIASAPRFDDFFFTAFSDSTDGPKPWKQDYGPRGKGVLFSAETGAVVLRDLTCPHSVRHDPARRPRGAASDPADRGHLYLCNSGYGEVHRTTIRERASHDGNETEAILNVPGFTRGLTFAQESIAFVGLSKVIDKYEPYAPGLVASDTRCGVVAFDLASGAELGSLAWPAGYQVYDVQHLPNVRRPLLPEQPADAAAINLALRYF